MALITCEDCGREVSDRAAACPHCGGPIDGATAEHGVETEETERAQIETDIDPDAVDTVEPKKKSNPVVAGCLGVVGFFVILSAIGSVIGGDESEAERMSDAGINMAADAGMEAAATEVGAAAIAAGAEQETDFSSLLSGSQYNAVRNAREYLAMSGFSRNGLIEQLSSEYGSGYARSDAEAAVDSLDVDWKEQAARSAQEYVNMTGFSCDGLIDQLSSEYGSGYTREEAAYGAASVGAC
ncbi:zinc-ribbon domain-containing protein [Erythrobacter litoralis]|uniref:Ltp family lipoprotein n=1 Tax=Erythrobacter litoralis TaxID=39960 RepID=UPI002435EC5B|nr:Ltp family lipoprotein [Erythrobacter litoralis]MDG6079774.1 zinc-ribbon domain-containing protein [Erythrobacter litoralis]